MTDEKTIKQRIEDAKENITIKQAIYSWRLALMGDFGRMGGKEMRTTPSRLSTILKQTDNFPDVTIFSFKEGDANHLYVWLLNLAETITFEVPTFEFPDLGDEPVSQLRSDYIRRRIFEDERVLSDITRAILAYSTDGLAFFKVFPFEGAPTIRWVDTLYVLWDVKSPSLHTGRFIAEQVRLVASEAEKWIGKENVSKLLGSSSSREGEAVVKFIEYWDDETVAFLEDGTHDVLRIYENKLGFIPYLVMTAPIPPSSFMPYPPIANAVGLQVLLSELGKSLVASTKASRPRFLVDTSKISEDTLESLISNPSEELFIKAQEGMGVENAIGFASAPGITQAEIFLYQQTVQEIVRHLRVNPFQSGAPINPRFATEAMLIGRVSGLYEKVLSSLWRRTLARIARMVVRVGYIYDVKPFPYHYKGQLIRFNETVPIQPLLQEDVPAIAYTSLFESTQETLVKINTLLSIIGIPQIQMRYPSLIDTAVQMLVRAFELRGDFTPKEEVPVDVRNGQPEERLPIQS